MGVLERIAQIEQEMARTQRNKKTEFHIGCLKARIARLNRELIVDTGSKATSGGFEVSKSGDLRCVLIGLPSVGKSTLLSNLTNTSSRAADFEFTTLDCIAGKFTTEGVEVQMVDLPGIIKGAAQGIGRGKQAASVARTADIVIFCLDATRDDFSLLDNELRGVGVRAGRSPPLVSITRTTSGGISITSLVKMSKNSADDCEKKTSLQIQNSKDSASGSTKYTKTSSNAPQATNNVIYSSGNTSNGESNNLQHNVLSSNLSKNNQNTPDTLIRKTSQTIITSNSDNISTQSRNKNQDSSSDHYLSSNIAEPQNNDDLSEEEIKGALRELGLTNCSIIIRSNCTLDDIVDTACGHVVYPKLIKLYTKVDLIGYERLKMLSLDENAVFISCKKKWGLEYFKQKVVEVGDLIRVYTKKRSQNLPDFDEPLVLKKSSTVRSACDKVHREFVDKFRYALVWGTSAKHQPQKVGLGHILQDEDVLQIFTQ